MLLHNPMNLAQTVIIVKMNTIVLQTHTIGVGGHTELKRAWSQNLLQKLPVH